MPENRLEYYKAGEYFIFDPLYHGHQVIGWKIWYSDKIISSKQMSWDQADDNDVQIVLLFLQKKDGMGRPTRIVFSGSDYYFTDGILWGASFTDITKAFGHIKFGKYLSDFEFNRLAAASMEDYDL